jgi:hypothetical protein
VKWILAIPAVAGVVSVAGGIATAVTGGQLEIALFVIGLAGATVPLAGIFMMLMLLVRKLPFVKVDDRSDIGNREVFWAYYVAFMAIIAGLIVWASVDETHFTDTATDFDYGHVAGILFLVIAAGAVGVVLERTLVRRSEPPSADRGDPPEARVTAAPG